MIVLSMWRNISWKNIHNDAGVRRLMLIDVVLLNFNNIVTYRAVQILPMTQLSAQRFT
jgi:hypothetical protein